MSEYDHILNKVGSIIREKDRSTYISEDDFVSLKFLLIEYCNW